MAETYRVPYQVLGPSEDTGDMYVAEALLLPGCRAWGETAEEAVSFLQSVAEAFIASYREHGDPLPEPVLDCGVLVVTA